MNLNMINLSRIVGLAASGGSYKSFNTRYGSASQVNEATFKYTPPEGPALAILIRRVDLGELFKGIPQDISDLDTLPVSANLSDDWNTKLGTDPVYCEPVFVDEAEDLLPSDLPGALFQRWKAMIGLSGLYRREVDLSLAGNVLHIDARNAVLYRGVVDVLVSKD